VAANVRRQSEHIDLPTVTCLVFDLPYAPWIGDVLRLRAAHDPARLRLPVEITVVGSSGLGPFCEGVARGQLSDKIRVIARAFSPFCFRFAGVACFPGSSVYYMAPHDSAPFHDFQRRIAACGLSFEPTPYRYTPHCTIAELPHSAPRSCHTEINACPVPDHEIRVASVSIYTFDAEALQCYQHESIALGV
jgi:hypothetical protein